MIRMTTDTTNRKLNKATCIRVNANIFCLKRELPTCIPSIFNRSPDKRVNKEIDPQTGQPTHKDLS